jgi:hypothetical protein
MASPLPSVGTFWQVAEKRSLQLTVNSQSRRVTLCRSAQHRRGLPSRNQKLEAGTSGVFHPFGIWNLQSAICSVPVASSSTNSFPPPNLLLSRGGELLPRQRRSLQTWGRAQFEMPRTSRRRGPRCACCSGEFTSPHGGVKPPLHQNAPGNSPA